MKNINIPRSIFDHKQKYLFLNGKVDIVGAILFELGFDVPEKTKFPSDLKIEIEHFTRTLRRRHLDSPLTQKLIALEVHPQETAVREANLLLQPYFHLTIIER